MGRGVLLKGVLLGFGLRVLEVNDFIFMNSYYDNFSKIKTL